MSDRKLLIEEANELGLEFQANVPTVKLQDMIAEAKGEPSKPADDPDLDEGEAPQKVMTKRQKIAAARKAAMKTRVVTITNKDPRDAAETNSCHLSFENNYFGLAKNVPLDVPVELEVALIKIAASALMPQHKKEYVGGKPTGNSIVTQVKKYAISYGE